MNWARFSIRNRYTIFALIIAVILFGIYAKNTLKVQLMPETAPPLVNVMTNYPGASAQEVAENVTEILEEEISLVDGVKKVKSTSQSDLSMIKVEFYYGINVDEAALDVQNAINKIAYKLPPMVQKPQVVKFNTSDKPILTVGLTSEELTLEEIRTIADNELKNQIQLLESIAAVDVFGGHQKQVNIYLNKDDVLAYNISSELIRKALSQNNIAASAGRIIEKDTESLIRVDEKFANIEELKNLIITEFNGQTIYLKDIARVEESENEQRSFFSVNGQEAISLQIIKKSDANTVETVKAALEQLRILEQKYPHIKFVIANNDAAFTNQVVSNMTSSIMAAIILTFLILLLFIVSINESLIVAFSMPLSFFSSLGLVKVFNLQLDLITLTALILSIGFVVDNSIVVVENIMRHHVELGKDIKTAAIEGTQEILLSVLAGTSTTLIVLIPLLFIEGFVGRVFGPLSKTLMFTLISSFFVSVTIIPLLVTLWQKGALLRKIENNLAKFINPFNNFMDKVKNFYLTVLNKSLSRKKTVLLGSLVILLISVVMLGKIGMEVFPKLDSGAFTISVETDPSFNLERTNKIIKDIEALLKKEPEVLNFSAQVGYEPGGHFLGETGALGVNQGYFTVELSSRKERQETIWQIEDRIREKIKKIPGIKSFIVKEAGSTAVATTVAPIDLRISGPDKEVLNYLAGVIEEKINQVPGTVNIYRSWHI
jgi:multidrug efflux pump subunit AcrB